MKHVHYRTLLVLVVAAGLAGCASKPEKTKADAAQTKPAQQQEEYVSETSVGSWIPKKVKKSQAKPSEQETREAQQAMSDLQRAGNAQPPAGN